MEATRTVAVVGLGAMGSRIARRFLDAGHGLVVWNRTPERAAALVESGALPAATPAEAARRANVVVTMVADAEALAAVTEGQDGVSAGVSQSTTLIEMSTVGPGAIASLASSLPPGVALLDAPVLGSVGEAESGSLTIFVGGPEAAVERMSPLLAVLGRPVHVGPLGAGAAAKLVANLTLFGTLGALGEALALADGLGLSRDAAFAVLATTPLAAQAERRRSAIERDEYPRRFSLSLARKDADLIVEAAAAAGVDLRLASEARRWLRDAERGGWGDRDYSSVLAHILGARGFATGQRQDVGLDFDGLIVDLDGVVWVGPEPVPGSPAAVAALRARGVAVVFLTNDPSTSRAECAARLAHVGIDASEAEIVTSGFALASLIHDREGVGKTAFVIGSRSLASELEQAGLELRDGDAGRDADVVAVGGHLGFDYAELRIAAQAVRRGARLYAAGRDATFPMPDGLWPATGSILAAVETAAGARAIVAGKPEAHIFEVARSLLPDRERIAIVGDHLEADIAGGKRAGLATILVLTGTTSREDLAASEIEPDVVLDDLASLAATRL